MMDYLQGQHPVMQAFLATCFTWGVTALGASLVFFFQNISRKIFDMMLGFTAGVMIAASCWSLLIPSIELSQDKDIPSWLPAVVGFALGGLFLRGVDRLIPHLQLGLPREQAEGISTNWRGSTLLVLAIMMHNIPEGLAIGVAFGAAAAGLPAATLGAAVALAIGIGIQNFPEGSAISLPLRREGLSRRRSFFYGQLSAIVEPIAGVIGAATVTIARPILPYALSFAAGAMIFVVVEEVIPESQRGGHRVMATMGGMIGFAVMMALDVAFS